MKSKITLELYDHSTFIKELVDSCNARLGEEFELMFGTDCLDTSTNIKSLSDFELEIRITERSYFGASNEEECIELVKRDALRNGSDNSDFWDKNSKLDFESSRLNVVREISLWFPKIIVHPCQRLVITTSSRYEIAKYMPLNIIKKLNISFRGQCNCSAHANGSYFPTIQNHGFLQHVVEIPEVFHWILQHGCDFSLHACLEAWKFKSIALLEALIRKHGIMNIRYYMTSAYAGAKCSYDEQEIAKFLHLHSHHNEECPILITLGCRLGIYTESTSTFMNRVAKSILQNYNSKLKIDMEHAIQEKDMNAINSIVETAHFEDVTRFIFYQSRDLEFLEAVLRVLRFDTAHLEHFCNVAFELSRYDIMNTIYKICPFVNVKNYIGQMCKKIKTSIDYTRREGIRFVQAYLLNKNRCESEGYEEIQLLKTSVGLEIHRDVVKYILLGKSLSEKRRLLYREIFRKCIKKDLNSTYSLFSEVAYNIIKTSDTKNAISTFTEMMRDIAIEMIPDVLQESNLIRARKNKLENAALSHVLHYYSSHDDNFVKMILKEKQIFIFV